MDTVVSVEGLRKSYGEQERIHGITFDVRVGEILGFLGTNGAGKTTTIEILEGYRPRNGGRVSVLGVDPAHATRAWRNRIGLVLQECELDPVYSVRETVAMFARYFRSPTDVEATIGAVGLTEKADDRVGKLSGGQKRRLDEAQHLADRIIILRAGEIAAQGTADELSASLGYHSEVTFDPYPGIDLAVLSAVVGREVTVRESSARFETDRVQGDLKLLLDWAHVEHVELSHLQAIQPSLDDVFVKLAGEAAPEVREVDS